MRATLPLPLLLALAAVHVLPGDAQSELSVGSTLQYRSVSGDEACTTPTESPDWQCVQACFLTVPHSFAGTMKRASSANGWTDTSSSLDLNHTSALANVGCSCPDPLPFKGSNEGYMQISFGNRIAVGSGDVEFYATLEQQQDFNATSQSLIPGTDHIQIRYSISFVGDEVTTNCIVKLDVESGTVLGITVVKSSSSSSRSSSSSSSSSSHSSSSSSSSHSSSSSSSSSSMPMHYASTIRHALADTDFSDPQCFSDPTLACLRECYLTNASVIDLNNTRPADSKDFNQGTLAFRPWPNPSADAVGNCSCPSFTAESNLERGFRGFRVRSQDAVPVGGTGTTLSLDVGWYQVGVEDNLPGLTKGDYYVELALFSEGRSCFAFYDLWYGTLFGATRAAPASSSSSRSSSSSHSSSSSSSSSSHSSSSSSSSSSMPLFHESTVGFALGGLAPDSPCSLDPRLACLRACFVSNASVLHLNNTRTPSVKDFQLGDLAFAPAPNPLADAVANCSCPGFTASSNREGGFELRQGDAVAVGGTGTTLSASVEWVATAAIDPLLLPAGAPDHYLLLGLRSLDVTCD
eukprot:CAMPEP_0173425548 /NCGR_PEP_ID=MMETSP1357-20121228/5240_1 /TAXON_ID=77926 /ORGANISM="Hemiselmis rufescens, Strain PCC563" /LENGTH=576 /DNA_ID=CAMNT_0014389011 /DNA_START=139 /DNA_END=1866 /DNA_ORIENTATION=-